MRGIPRIFVAAAVFLFAAAAAFSGRPVLSADCAPYFSGGADLAPVEGVWLMSGDGALLAIERRAGSLDVYDVVLLDSPDFTVMPGTQLGLLRQTARAGVYDVSLRTAPGLRSDYKDKLGRGHDYVLELGEDGRFTLSGYHRGKRISLRRWLPYLFRVSVVENSTRPEGLDGAVRVFPPSAGARGPVVL